jgi:hypothetical protein
MILGIKTHKYNHLHIASALFSIFFAVSNLMYYKFDYDYLESLIKKYQV